jgi:hypothetical protein
MMPEKGRSSSRIATSFVNEIRPVLVHPVVHSDCLVLPENPALATASSPQAFFLREDILSFDGSNPHGVDCCDQGPKHA